MREKFWLVKAPVTDYITLLICIAIVIRILARLF